MSRALISYSGTGEFEGAAGVKTAKLCVEQDQIGEYGWPIFDSRVRSLEEVSNNFPRGMVVQDLLCRNKSLTESGLSRNV